MIGIKFRFAMEVLQLNRELLDLFRFRAKSDGTPWYTKLRRQVIIAVMLIFLLFGWASSVVFIVKYIKIDTISALYAIFQVASEFSANYTVFVMCLYPETTDSMFIKFNDVRKNGKFLLYRIKFVVNFPRKL